jgi:predicted amidophosphoribosyltransferase
VDVGGGAYKALCPRCREIPPNYRQAVAALRYVGPLTRAIPSWKYAGRRDLSPVFSNLLTDWVSAKAPKWWESIDAIVPAAHHSKTIRRRGFSPPEDLAFPLGSAFSKPVLARTLFKIRFTPPQTGLTREQRVANLHESMRVFDSDLVDSRIILVVDDVMTTGATLNECARALLKAGAKRVYGLVLARQTDLSR